MHLGGVALTPGTAVTDAGLAHLRDEPDPARPLPQRQELLGGVDIAVLDGGQDARDFRHGQPPAALGIAHDNRLKPMNKVR
jgi:hypothetical protein